MRLSNHRNCHLTYCTNIHPGESWMEVFRQVKLHIPELKRRLSPEKPFGVGLRLSAVAAGELLEEDHLQNFSRWLEEKDLYVFTMNGFPYGDFHGQVVKDRVYQPDWTSAKRVDYTLNLARILANLLPEGMEGGISTSPLSYKYWLEDAGREQVYQKSTDHLAKVAYEMEQIGEATGKEIHLDIEPEPDCLLENSRETIFFFENWLLSRGVDLLSGEHHLTAGEAERILRNRIRVCYDTCHFAVEFEDPAEAVESLQRAGIKIGKTQISAALKIDFEKQQSGDEVMARLQAFEEKTYLHQVVERRSNGTLRQYRDLPEAFESLAHYKPQEWRVHYHVPIFLDAYEGLKSTQEEIKESLKILFESTDCRHYEIETYTWSVLPEDLKTELVPSIEREFRWALSQADSVSDFSNSESQG